MRGTFRAGVPQIYLNIDREKAEQMGVQLNDVFARSRRTSARCT